MEKHFVTNSRYKFGIVRFLIELATLQPKIRKHEDKK